MTLHVNHQPHTSQRATIPEAKALDLQHTKAKPERAKKVPKTERENKEETEEEEGKKKMNKSSIAPQHLPSLKRLARLQLLPAAHAASLDAEHVLPAVGRAKVRHRRRFGGPRVPDDGVVELVADDVEAGPVVFAHGGGVLGDFVVDAVCFGGDAEGGRGLGGGAGVEDFVGVGRAKQASDGDLGYVLARVMGVG